MRIGAGSWLGHGTVVLPGRDDRPPRRDRRQQRRARRRSPTTASPPATRPGRQAAATERAPCASRDRPSLEPSRARAIAEVDAAGRSAASGCRRRSGSSLSLIGMPSTAVSANGSLLPGAQLVGELPAVLDVRAVVGLPQRHDGRALGVGRRARRRRRRASARRCRWPGRRCRRARRASPGRPGRRGGSRRAPCARPRPPRRSPRPASAQARSPILLTASFEAKNSAQTQNAANSATTAMSTKRQGSRRATAASSAGAAGVVAVAVIDDRSRSLGGRPVAHRELGGARRRRRARAAISEPIQPSHAVQSRPMAWSRLHSPGPTVATAQATTRDRRAVLPALLEDEEAVRGGRPAGHEHHADHPGGRERRQQPERRTAARRRSRSPRRARAWTCGQRIPIDPNQPAVPASAHRRTPCCSRGGRGTTPNTTRRTSSARSAWSTPARYRPVAPPTSCTRRRSVDRASIR